jgi:hypothetical protein
MVSPETVAAETGSTKTLNAKILAMMDFIRFITFSLFAAVVFYHERAHVTRLLSPSFVMPHMPGAEVGAFKTLMRNMGLVDYWRAKGWPQSCHPNTGHDFECN